MKLICEILYSFRTEVENKIKFSINYMITIPYNNKYYMLSINSLSKAIDSIQTDRNLK